MKRELRRLPFFVAVSMILSLQGCGSEEPALEEAAVEEPTPADPAKVAICTEAKSAAVDARKEYDRDYERRNPGSTSKPLFLSELDSCRLVSEGAFVGKWGGERWRFVPGKPGSFSKNPRQVWISDQPPAGEPRMWFSEWRSTDATDAKTSELDKLLAAAEVIE